MKNVIKLVLFGACSIWSAVALAAVDANTANAADLDSVKGIGPSTSTRIIEARKTAPFKDWADFVERVPGIGPGNAAKLSGNGLTINGQAYKGAATAQPTATPATPPTAKPAPKTAAATAEAAKKP